MMRTRGDADAEVWETV